MKLESNELTSTSSTNHSQLLTNVYQYLKKSEIDEIKAVSSSLNQFLEYLDAKDDCFTVGLLSKIVANELSTMNSTKSRRKNASHKVSLLLIDRNLDLSNPSLYHDETHFDKMSNLLNNFTSIANDVKFELNEILMV